jgi:hypothetical protein
MRRIMLFGLFLSVCSFHSAQAAFVTWAMAYSQFLDVNDVNNVRNHFGTSGRVDVLGDYNYDGIVELTDLNLVRNHFGDLTPRVPNAVYPANPNANDLIRITLDPGYRGDTCGAESQSGGAPKFVVNYENKAIEIDFDPNDRTDVCAEIPEVIGVYGEIGSLPAGSWTLGLVGRPPLVSFEVGAANAVPEPSGWWLALAGLPVLLFRNAFRGKGAKCYA